MDRDQRRRARQPGRTTQQRLADAYAGYRAGLLQLPADDYLDALARAGELAEWEGFAFWDVQRARPGAPELARFRHEPSGLLFVLVPGGSFRFGASLREPGRQRGDPAPVEVRVEPFLIAETPVTRRAWERLVEPAGRWAAGPLPRARELTGAAGERPMEGLRYEHALAWCRAAGLLRVPGEVEWEYACRGGRRSLFAGANALPPSAANTLHSGHEATLPVRTYPPNDFGLYDLHGNVAEWCADQTLGFRALRQRDLKAWHEGGRRRGGSFASLPEECRCAALDRDPERPGPDGFRPVRSLEPQAPPPRADEGPSSEAWAYRCGGLGLGLPAAEGSRYAEALRRARARPDLRYLGRRTSPLAQRGRSKPEVMANDLRDQGCQLARFVHEPSGLVMVLVPGGPLLMGSDEQGPGEPAERPARRVHVDPFLLAVAPLTREVTALPMGSGLVEVRGLPATGISWFQARELCAERGLRLPSEAEWEHACRAGSRDAYSWGDDWQMGWGQRRGNFASHRPTPVERYEPNRFGLRDMHGNVEEWCEDAWHPSYEGAPGRAQPAWADEAPGGLPWEESLRVLRGGCFLSPVHHCRSASRSAAHPGTRSETIGVRPALSV